MWQNYSSVNFCPLLLMREPMWHIGTKISQNWLLTWLLNRLDENVSKILLDKKYQEVIIIELKYQYVSLKPKC